jgi:hypothetical protein
MVTGKKPAHIASKELRSTKTPAKVKTVAASDLSQAAFPASKKAAGKALAKSAQSRKPGTGSTGPRKK